MNFKLDREIVPINYYSNRIRTSVEDGVWIERTATAFDSLLMARNMGCISPLSASSTRYFKYNFSGQLTDSLSELPTNIFNNNFYGSKLIEDQYSIRNITGNSFDITVFDKSLRPSTQFRLDITKELTQFGWAHSSGKLKVLDARAVVMPFLVRDGSPQRQYVMLAFVKNGVVTEFTKSTATASSFSNIIDLVTDASGNLHLLLSNDAFLNQKRKFSFLIFDKNTKEITRTVDFENNDFRYQLSLSPDKKGVYLINEMPVTFAVDKLAFKYYNFENQEVSEVKIPVDLLGGTATQAVLYPMRNASKPLIRITPVTTESGSENKIFSINNDAKLELEFREKSNSFGLVPQSTPNGLVGFELDVVGDERNLKTYLLIHNSLNEIEPTLITNGTGRFSSGCY